MGGLQIVQVDERDSGRGNIRPTFRVYLHGSGPTATHGWTDTDDLTGADLLQVIDWAQRQAGDSLTYAVALVDDRPRDQMILDPAEACIGWLEWMATPTPSIPTTRKLSTACVHVVREAVGVPLADRIPASAPDPYNDGTRRR